MIIMNRILTNWDIDYNNTVKVKEGVWKIDNCYYLKASNDDKWVMNLKFYKMLRAFDIPAPEVICTLNGKNFVTYDNKNYFLTRKLKGVHLSKEEIMDDLAIAHSVGQVIARLHKAYFNITNDFVFNNNNFIDELNGWIRTNLKEHARNSFTYSIFDECVKELDLVYGCLKRHLIHRDMHLGNLLFQNNIVTGYIDFDLSQINARVFDIAYLLVGWLVGEVHDNDFLIRWKNAKEAVIEGYQEELKLTNVEINSLGIMMCCIEILFTAYFYSIEDEGNVIKAEQCLRWLWDNRKDI